MVPTQVRGATRGMERPIAHPPAPYADFSFGDLPIGSAVATPGSRVPTPALQRVIETATNYKRAGEIREMTLADFDAYAQQQADWHAGPELQEMDRNALRRVLGFGRGPGVLAACGGMAVGELAPLEDEDFEKLLVYTRMQNEKDPFEMMRVDHPGAGVRRAESIEPLVRAFGSDTLRTTMPGMTIERVTRGLQTYKEPLTDDIVKYRQQAHFTPSFEATNGNDFNSYVDMRERDKVDPLAYDKEPLRGRVRNFHRFEGAALDRLQANYAYRARDKPLTVILHSALDHNGAFHRKTGETAVIANSRILTLMVEGGETLEAYGKALPELAEYGIDGKIDQVLITGHGQMRAVELAGTPEAHDDIDLDRNRTATDELFATIFDHLDRSTKRELDAIETGGGPHHRFVFNACLTNTNYVPVSAIPRGDFDTIAAAVRKYIAETPTLAVYVRGALQTAGLGDWSSQGANAVTRASGLIDEKSGRLGLSSETDKAVVADKLDYVAMGIEPIGVFRAAVECLTWTDPMVVRACVKDMTTRAETASTNWRETFIAAGFRMALAQAPEQQPWLLTYLSEQSLAFEELNSYSTARVSSVAGISRLGEMAIPFFQGLAASTAWNSATFRLPILQAWLGIEQREDLATELLEELAKHDCGWLHPVIDLDVLGKADLGRLLSLKPEAGALRLACLAVLGPSADTAASEYLQSVLGKDQRFDPSLGMTALLGGLAHPDLVQARIGRPVPPLEVESPELRGNLRLAGDESNKARVRSITSNGVARPGGANLYAAMDTGSEVFTTAAATAALRLFGEAPAWFAVEYSADQPVTRVGYILNYELGPTQDSTVGAEVEMYASIDDLTAFENARNLAPSTALTVLAEGLGEDGDVVRIQITETEKRYKTAFARKQDVDLVD